MDKVDRRIKRSQRLLGEALFSLILEKGYDAVTIKDITERADVAYVTFFRHYKDKDELLNLLLEENIHELLERISQSANASGVDNQDKREGELIFKHVEENADLNRILLNSQGATRVRKRITEAIAAIFLNNCWKVLEKSSEVPSEVAANHMAASLLALIAWWLERNMPYSVEKMAEIYHKLIIRGTIYTVIGSVPECEGDLS